MKFPCFYLVLLSFYLQFGVLFSATNKPHHHNGILPVYDGHPITIGVSKDQSIKLDRGEAVIVKERKGKLGEGYVIQDINASELICMNKILDFQNYPRMVPHLKSLDVYETIKFNNVMQ